VSVKKEQSPKRKIWQGWFKPTAKRPLRADHFLLSEIEKNSLSPRSKIFTEKKTKRLVISVPGQVGKAYQRNKLRRQIKNYLINNKSENLLSPGIDQGERGLWVRISPYYRVEKKMEFEIWKMLLKDKIKSFSK